jgi:hypothetical protein
LYLYVLGSIVKRRHVSILVILLLVGNCYGLITAHGSETITQSDFAAGDFSKTIDLFEYAREHAEAIGGTPPQQIGVVT